MPSSWLPSWCLRSLIAELRRPEGPPSGAPYPYRKLRETHELIFSWARTHGGDDDDGGVAQDGCHPPNNRLTEIGSPGLLCDRMCKVTKESSGANKIMRNTIDFTSIVLGSPSFPRLQTGLNDRQMAASREGVFIW